LGEANNARGEKRGSKELGAAEGYFKDSKTRKTITSERDEPRACT